MAFIIKPLITEKMTNITEKSSMDRTYKPKTGAHRGEEVTKKAQPKYGFIVKPEANKNVYLSARNLQKAECIIAANVNTYKVLNADVMVITENSLKAIDGVLG